MVFHFEMLRLTIDINMCGWEGMPVGVDGDLEGEQNYLQFYHSH